jgi:hypothetical protein
MISFGRHLVVCDQGCAGKSFGSREKVLPGKQAPRMAIATVRLFEFAVIDMSFEIFRY